MPPILIFFIQFYVHFKKFNIVLLFAILLNKKSVYDSFSMPGHTYLYNEIVKIWLYSDLINWKVHKCYCIECDDFRSICVLKVDFIWDKNN